MRDVLVVQWSRLGDVLQTRPLLCSLKTNPANRVTLCCDKRYLEIAALFPEVDRIVPFDLERVFRLSHENTFQSELLSSLKEAFPRALPDGNPNLAIVLSRSTAAALLPVALGYETIKGYGWSKGQLSEPPEIRWLAEQCSNAIESSVHLSDLWMRMSGMVHSAAWPTRIGNFFETHPAVHAVGIVCDSGSAERTPPLVWIDQLLNALEHSDVKRVSLFGAHRMVLPKSSGSPGRTLQISDYRGRTTLRELTERFAECDLVVGPDTGALHLAGACGTKTLGIFTPNTNPHLTGVYASGALSIEATEGWTAALCDQIVELTKVHTTGEIPRNSKYLLPIWQSHLDASGCMQRRIDKDDEFLRQRRRKRREFFGAETEPVISPVTLRIVIPEVGQTHLTDALVDKLATWQPPFALRVCIVSSGDECRCDVRLAQHELIVKTSQKRLTFAEACNLGTQDGNEEWLLFLNNDIKLESDALDALLASRETNALSAPIVKYPDGTLQNAGVELVDDYPREIGAGQLSLSDQIPDCLSAIALLVERRVFQDLGGFDIGFHNGFEDLDFSLRAANYGCTLKICRAAEIVHLRSCTPGRFERDQENYALFMQRWGRRFRRSRAANTSGSTTRHPRLVIVSEESEVAAGPYLRWARILKLLGLHSGRDYHWMTISGDNELDHTDRAFLQQARTIVVFRPVTNETVLRHLESRPEYQRLVTDCDDLVLSRFRPDSRRGSNHRERELAYKTLLSVADVNLVATQHLADSLRSFGFDSVVALTVPDPSIAAFIPNLKDKTPVRIGFVGHAAHATDIGMIMPALESLFEENDEVELVWWGCRPGELAYHPRVMMGGPYLPDYAQHLNRILPMNLDIALVPLLDTPHNNARSPVKYFDWATLGVPGIYSDVVPYSSVVQHGKTGLIAGDRISDWIDAMNELIHNANLRRQIAEQSRHDVLKRSQSAVPEQYAEVLGEVGRNYMRNCRIVSQSVLSN